MKYRMNYFRKRAHHAPVVRSLTARTAPLSHLLLRARLQRARATSSPTASSIHQPPEFPHDLQAPLGPDETPDLQFPAMGTQSDTPALAAYHEPCPLPVELVALAPPALE